MSENYKLLLPEIAEILNMSVTEIESRPADIQQMLCHIYKRNDQSDKPTIQKALGEVISLNIKTRKEIETAEKEKELSSSTSKSTIQNAENDKDNYKRSLVNRLERTERLLRDREAEINNNNEAEINKNNDEIQKQEELNKNN